MATQDNDHPVKNAGVFLSYKRQDVEIVTKFFNDLRIRAVASVWMDIEGIRDGEQWQIEIEEAIHQRSHLVLFITPDALKSDVIKLEYELAHKLGMKIIPIMVKDVPIDELPPLIQKYQISLNYERDGYESTLFDLASVLPRSYHVPEMVYIPYGSFTMGPPENEFDLELDDFWIARTSVTVADYVCFVLANGYSIRDYWIEDTLDRWQRGPRENNWPRRNLETYALENPNKPMRGITWYEALAYSRWLSIITGHSFTLPTEAQWEKSARGSDKRKWANGNTLMPEFVDIALENPPCLEPHDCGIVGSESPFGCLDMIGNVWNWTTSIDLPLPYEQNDETDSMDDLDEWRIIRGGSWLRSAAKATTYHRESQSPIPNDYRYDIGFRLITNSDPTHR